MLITRTWNDYWMTYRQDQKRSRPETSEQIDFISWVRFNHPQIGKLLFHPVNEGQQLPQHRISLIKQGMEAGVSDVIMLQSGYDHSAGVIELKRDDRGSVSLDQKLMLIACHEAGKFASVAYGCESAKAAFNDYMFGLDADTRKTIIYKPMRNAPAKLPLKKGDLP